MFRSFKKNKLSQEIVWVTLTVLITKIKIIDELVEQNFWHQAMLNWIEFSKIPGVGVGNYLIYDFFEPVRYLLQSTSLYFTTI